MRLALAAFALAVLSLPAIAAADLADETALAERFAPIVRLVEQAEECGYGEPYRPIDVDVCSLSRRSLCGGRGTAPTSSGSLRRRGISRASTSTTSTSPGTRSTRVATTNCGRGA